MNKFPYIVLLVLLLVVSSGCTNQTLQADLTPTPSQLPIETPIALATPVSQEPAAGICASPVGETAELVLEPDMPDPRCMKVTADQFLKVTNRTEQTLEISLGSLHAELAPNQDITFQVGFGEVLQPGVHRVNIPGYAGGAEIWLVP